MLLQNYLVKQLLLSTLVIATGLTMIIWLTQSLRLLDLVINGGAPISLFGTMLALTIPKFFELILPIALAVSIVFLFNKLIGDSELIVMQACGLSPWQLARAVVVLSLGISLVVFALGGWLTPHANRELDRLKNVAKSDIGVGLLRAGVFNTLGDNVTIYLSERRSLSDLRGLLIYFNPPGKSSSTIWAKRGGIVMKNKDEPVVVVHDGMRQEYNPKTNKVESLRFESYRVDLTNFFQKATRQTVIDPGDYELNHLLDPAQALNADQRRQFTAEIHQRLSRPFLVISFALCAVTPFLLGRFNRRGQAMRVVMVILMLISLQAAYLGSNSLSQRHVWGSVLLYAVSVMPAVIALWFLFKLQITRSTGWFKIGRSA